MNNSVQARIVGRAHVQSRIHELARCARNEILSVARVLGEIIPVCERSRPRKARSRLLKDRENIRIFDGTTLTTPERSSRQLLIFTRIANRGNNQS